MREFEKYPLVLILGASGTGKTTIFTELLGRLPNCVMIDADIFWRDEFNTPETNFLEFKRYCLKIAGHISQNNVLVVYFLQGTPDDFEQISERSSFSHLHYLFLVCEREELVHRLKKKPKGWGLLEKNPDHLENLLHYNEHLKQIAQDSEIPVIDTSKSSVEEASNNIYTWISSFLAG